MKDSEGSDYLGVVFAYQSNRKFYIVMWRRETINFGKSDTNAGIKGLQLKVRGIHRAHKLYTDCDRLKIKSTVIVTGKPIINRRNGFMSRNTYFVEYVH